MAAMNQFTFPRRTFLTRLGLGAPLALAVSGTLPAGGEGASPRPAQAARRREMQADLVVIGGGLGGCAAALAGVRNGLRVILTEETGWLGGQLTAQAVPPDEHPWIESCGATASYLDMRQRIRDYYRRNYPLTANARSTRELNPGNGWVSRLCCEPRPALAALEEALAPQVSGGRLTVLRCHRAVDAALHEDRVTAVRVRDESTGDDVVLQGNFFADATELGELLPMTKTEYVTGFESRATTAEPHAPEVAQPGNMQAFTCCFAMDYVADQDHTIERPSEYSFWRDFVPAIRPAWPGKLLSMDYGDPVSGKSRNIGCDPVKGSGLWTYRRIADMTNFTPGTYPGDISLVNWPQNDYLLGNLCEVSSEEAARHLARAKQLSLSLLYWLQNECPRPDGGTGWKGLRLRGDIVGTADGLAKFPYIRESRRIRAEFTVCEQHVSTEARMRETGRSREEVAAAPFADSVGIGSYRIDLHPSSGGDNSIDVSSLPFQIPLGALLPVRVENLFPACKNIGTTHITNGCYRLHPVEWNIGEAVGSLAAFCHQRRVPARKVRQDGKLLADFQKLLTSQGVPLVWPRFGPR